jgi:23S rRNA pseudouridine955/2504/2580 synthase
MKEFLIGENDAGQRADKFLRKACPKLPQSLLYKAFRRRDVKQNGRRIPPETVLQCGDTLAVYLPDDCFEPAQRTALRALPPPVICYEDAQIAVMKKPLNLPVHADGKGSSDTLIARFLYFLAQKGEYDPAQEQSFTPALCNRLDRNTEGLVIGAKTAASLREVNALIRNGSVQKQYLCITAGIPPKAHDTVTAYHRREPGQSAEIAGAPREGFRRIVTEYELLQKHDGLALLRVTLHTGRTHQIRAQMAALHCPVLGDPRYGDSAANRSFHADHQLLAAYALTLDVPRQGHVLSAVSGRRISYLPDFVTQYGFAVSG